MRTLVLVPLSLLGLLALVRDPALAAPAASSASASATATAAPTAGTFEIDGVHSSVIFAVRHLGVAYSYGRFNGISGTFTQAEDAAKCSLKVEVAAASVDTANEGRDRHLKGPDFFNVEQFPKITFQSTKVTKKGEGLHVEGELTLHGVKQSVSMELEHVGEADLGERMGFRSGWRGSFQVKRSDFGMNYGIENGAVSDVVELTVAVEGVKQS